MNDARNKKEAPGKIASVGEEEEGCQRTVKKYHRTSYVYCDVFYVHMIYM
jgi:hypothetical protein